MEVLNNYLNYRRHKKEYSEWEQQKLEQEAKRAAYLKRNGIDEKQKENDIKRAKAILNAVDVMDEYSQVRAENTELAIQSLGNFLSSVASCTITPLILLGLALYSKSKFLQNVVNNIGNIAKNKYGKAGLIAAGAAIAGTAFTFAIAIYATWSAKKEMQASRNGRYEAMITDLASEKQFAVLTQEQEVKRDEIAKTIKIDKKERKNLINTNKKGGFVPINTLKEIFIKNNKQEKEREEYIKSLQNDETKFKNTVLSENEIEEAKKDKQLIQNIVKKIDIASQDYAENIELATGAIQTVALSGGVLSGFAVKKLTSLFKSTAKHSTVISVISGLALFLPIASFATKLQKEGSRIARFKVKQELLNNPESLVYVDDDKAKNENVQVQKEKNKNYFARLKEVFDNYKEYKNYLKENITDIKQKQKAQEQIELTPEQIKRAKQLQNNVFKMFNKVDENSQKYSESTEAMGQIVSGIVQVFCALLSTLNAKKLAQGILDSPKISVKNIGNVLKVLAPALGAIIFDSFITKEQKGASRVADMIAIKEMDDYRHFASYSNESQNNNDKQTTYPGLYTPPPWKK